MRLLLVLGLRFLGFRSLVAQANPGDFDPGQLPPMADGAVITFAAAILERDDLLVFALLDDFTGDSRTFDERAPVGSLVAVAVKKHVRKHALFAGFLIEEIDIDYVSFRDAMLSAACFDNCVSHTRSWVLSGGKAAQIHTDGAL